MTFVEIEKEKRANNVADLVSARAGLAKIEAAGYTAADEEWVDANNEVEMSQADIKDMMNFWDSNFDVHRSWHNGNNYWRDNTYNCNANIDHDIDYRIVESAHDGVWFAFMVHRYGDVRGNYTDWAVCKFNYVESIFELESVMQYKDIIGKYVADINIFTEGYEVYDYINDKDVGTFYDVEVDDLLNSIAELEGEN